MNRPNIPSFLVTVDADVFPIVVEVSGEFDLTKVPQFETATASLSRSVSVVVDLSSTSLIDSAGLGAILRLRRDQLAGGGTLVVRASRPYQRQLFTVTGLAHLLEPSGDE